MRARDSLRGIWHALPQLAGFKFGEHQQRHLQWLIEQCGEPSVWDGKGDDQASTLIVVTRPPTGPQVDLLCGSLSDESVVVIPFGENPDFDFLRSRLAGYGTVSPSGADGPHQLWWGGLNWRGFKPKAKFQSPLVISCYPRSAGTEIVDRLAQSLDALGLEHVIEPIDDGGRGSLAGIQKINFILDNWVRKRPILWIEPGAIVMRSPALLETVECDIALHRWRTSEISSRTLFFGCSEAAGAVLRTWQRLAEWFPTVWEGYLLDQAWSTSASKSPVRTLWLPRSYHSIGDKNPEERTVIVHALPVGTTHLGPLEEISGPVRTARRAGRTGAPEPQLIIESSTRRQGPIVVVLRQDQSSDTHAVAATVENIAEAYSNDSGGFDRLELSLCRWQQDLKSALAAADHSHSWCLVIDSTERIPHDLFQHIGQQVTGSATRRVIRWPQTMKATQGLLASARVHCVPIRSWRPCINELRRKAKVACLSDVLPCRFACGS